MHCSNRLGFIMLVKIDNGFYLNTQHIIAIRVARVQSGGKFNVNVDYTPNNAAATGSYLMSFDHKSEAEEYLNSLNIAIGKA